MKIKVSACLILIMVISGCTFEPKEEQKTSEVEEMDTKKKYRLV